MKHPLLTITLALCCGALIPMLLELGTTPSALAAPPMPQNQQPKTEILPIRPEQPQPKDQGKTAILPIQTGKPLGTIGELEWYVIGLQFAVQELQGQTKTLMEQTKTLQEQAATDQNTIRTLQTSLQTLQTQYANHSHHVNFPVSGHDCMALDQYKLQNANSGNTDMVALFHEAACKSVNGVIPLSTRGYSVDANVSTPVQGAQQTGTVGVLMTP